MTFDAKETSRYDGSPINLYLFRYGPDPDSYYAYTDHTEIVQPEANTRRSVYISVDTSSYISSGDLADLKTVVNSLLDDIDAEISNGLDIDVAVNLWSDTTDEAGYASADAADIVSLKAHVDAATASGNPDWNNAVSGAKTWFETTAADSSISRRAMIIIHSGIPGNGTYLDASKSINNILARSGGSLNNVNGNAVDVYSVNISEQDTRYAQHLDNTPQDGIPVVDPGDADLLSAILNRAVLNTIEYTPVPIDRNGVRASGNLDRIALTIKMPKSVGLASLYNVYPPTWPVSLVLRQGHVGDAQFPAVWSGRVLNMARREYEVEFTCEPIATSMRRPGLRRHWQYGCPHVLYGSQCRADRTAATISATPTAKSGNTLTMPAAWFGSIDVNKYLNGIVEWNDADGNRHIRTTLQISGGKDLILNGPVSTLPDATAVKISLGCNHQMSDCGSLHVEINTSGESNIRNYGGQWLIPTKNPIGNNNQYY